MAGGRPPSGSRLVDGIEGSEHARRRLEAILDTIRGEISIDDACARIAVGSSAFHQLRARALEAAMQSLEPGRPGRPARVVTDAERRVAELEEELNDLKLELQTARVREELFAAIPSLAERQAGKKGGRRRRANGRTDGALPPPHDQPRGAPARGTSEDDRREAGHDAPSA